MTLIIMGLEVKEIPLKPKEIEFDKDGKTTKYVDSKGQTIRKIQVQASEYKWVYEDGTPYTGKKAFKSIKGKPVKEFSKSVIIDKYATIDKASMIDFVQNELTYLIVNEKFKEKMIELGDQAIQFKYVNRGFKVHQAVVYYDKAKDRVFMRCFRGNLNNMDLVERQEVEEIETKEEAVDQLDLDSLEV